jgi:hypothetical protein
MSRPARKDCAAFVENKDGTSNIRVARFGRAPLVHVWVHKLGEGGKGIILNVEEATDLVDGLNDLLDDIEGVES